VLGLRDGSEVLDLGCGTGWTTLFLAEAGYRPLGLSLAPSEIEVARKRAERWQSAADFVVGDMDSFDLDRQFDAVLLFDALHHSVRPGVVIDNVAQHLRSGGWLLIGEPSILHSISPDARRTHKELGWMEKGVSIRAVKHWCSQSGMGDFQRFFEGTRPYTGRGRPFLWQLVRLVAANFAVAPQTSVWLAARKLGER
jgi:2-polyprenyl-3-methyl-5-hydroxy-6-metoxy-1,4-benzoquinol methylase